MSWTLLKPLMSHDHFFGHPRGLEAKTADRKEVLNADLPLCNITWLRFIQPLLHTRHIVYDFLRSKKTADIKGSIVNGRMLTTHYHVFTRRTSFAVQKTVKLYSGLLSALARHFFLKRSHTAATHHRPPYITNYGGV